MLCSGLYAGLVRKCLCLFSGQQKSCVYFLGRGGLPIAAITTFPNTIFLPLSGLYGKNGILPARKMLRFTGKGFWEQLKDSPTLLWLGPRLGLDTEQGVELLCLLGTLLSFGALILEPLRDSLVFLALWAIYLSVYQVWGLEVMSRLLRRGERGDHLWALMHHGSRLTCPSNSRVSYSN